MGTRRKPSPPGRARLALLATAAAGTAVMASGAAAHAEPGGDLATVKAQVDKLDQDAEAATEKYDGIQAKQQQLQAQASQIQARVAVGQERINQMREQLGAVAAAQYRNGGIDPSVRLVLSSDPDTYLKRAAAEERVATDQAQLLAQLQRDMRSLDQDRAEAAAALQDLDALRVQLAAEKQDVQGKLAQAQSLLNRLSAADRARLRAMDGANAAASRSADRPTYTGPATGRAASAVQFAYAQLGRPYEWGATGPSSYDCSGLTGAAWRAAGVSLPRVSRDQWNAGPHIARSDLQPGDLVFFFSDLHHVGIYIGNGKMIHAPRTGENVQILNLDYMPEYMGAVRPG